MNTVLTQVLKRFVSESWYFPQIRVVDAVEILIITFLFYQIILWIKNTKAWMLLRGILVVALFILVAAVFKMYTILWIAQNSLPVMATAVVIIFQPELRRALEKLGEKQFVPNMVTLDKRGKDNVRFSQKTIDGIVEASFAMGAVKTGALIVVEQAIMLTEYESTGIALDCIVSPQVLINIFEHNTPLHDGAVVIANNQIVSAACILPLTDDKEMARGLGTRHRAAIGISKESDAVVVVVSEETGKVSIAKDGTLIADVSEDALKRILMKHLVTARFGSEERTTRMSKLRGKVQAEKKKLQEKKANRNK